MDSDTPMFTITSLLVPTDFSPSATKAFHLALQIAKGNNAMIHVLHVVEPVVYPADWNYAQVGFADIEQDLVQTSEEQLQKLVTEANNAGVEIVTACKRGRASEEICSYALENTTSIIAIGTHGHTGLEHFLFGSTTERVLKKAPCPVLSVRLDMPTS
jgi:nucleotide-binding universal stress UspA family protein